MLESPDAIGAFIEDYPLAGLNAVKLEENVYNIYTTIEGYSVQCKLQWTRGIEEKKPYDFSDKNMVRLIPSKGILGGSDIGKTLDIGMTKLLNDDTVAEMMKMLQSGQSEQR